MWEFSFITKFLKKFFFWVVPEKGGANPPKFSGGISPQKRVSWGARGNYFKWGGKNFRFNFFHFSSLKDAFQGAKGGAQLFYKIGCYGFKIMGIGTQRRRGTFRGFILQRKRAKEIPKTIFFDLFLPGRGFGWNGFFLGSKTPQTFFTKIFFF